MKLAYLELSVADLMEDIQVGEDDLLAAYEIEKADYATQETRSASHILIEAADGADEQSAQERAAGLLAEIEAGVTTRPGLDEMLEQKGLG